MLRGVDDAKKYEFKKPNQFLPFVSGVHTRYNLRENRSFDQQRKCTTTMTTSFPSRLCLTWMVPCMGILLWMVYFIADGPGKFTLSGRENPEVKSSSYGYVPLPRSLWPPTTVMNDTWTNGATAILYLYDHQARYAPRNDSTEWPTASEREREAQVCCLFNMPSVFGLLGLLGVSFVAMMTTLIKAVSVFFPAKKPADHVE